jgi:hypothetical protein
MISQQMFTRLGSNTADQHQQVGKITKKLSIPWILFPGKIAKYRFYPALPCTAVQVRKTNPNQTGGQKPYAHPSALSTTTGQAGSQVLQQSSSHQLYQQEQEGTGICWFFRWTS